MMWFFLVFLGLSIGSFINCLVYRLNHELSPLRGRSFCPKCKHQLVWQDNIPLLSFILLKGKCRYCHSPISWQYPLVELTAAILTILVYWLSGYELQVTGYNLIISYALLAIFVSDLLYFTIPNEIVFFAIGISFLYSHFAFRISHFAISALLVAAFFYLLVLITRGKGMGLGDVKLAGLMGLILGWPKILLALYLAFLTGAVIGVILILLKKKKFGQYIPFGPFLTGATFISMFWGEVIFQWGKKLLELL